MTKQHAVTVLALLLSCHVVTAFVPPRSGFLLQQPTFIKQPMLLFMSSNDEASPKRKKRRRRKDPLVSTTPPTAPDLKPRRQDGPVEMEIQDVRRVVSGNDDDDAVIVESSSLSQEPEPTIAKQEEDEDEEDDEYEYYYIDDEGNEVVVSEESLNSLDQLLIDARQMEEDEKRQRALKAEESEEEPATIQSTIAKVLSTIVTIDFFVVCALLLWFLAGIFCSYILKNDAVQIAFNGIFEPVVQPALGVLMLGSAAGALFREEEEEDGLYPR